MNKLLKIITSLALGFSFFVGFSPVTTNAAEIQTIPVVDLSNIKEVNININSVDPREPFIQIRQYKDSEGNPYTLGLQYTPSDDITTNAGNTDPIDVYTGTWKSWFDGTVVKMSYEFDVEKSGTHWKISNPRNHSYGGAFITFSNAKLSVSRAVSTSSFPAEVNASADAKVFDNAWLPLYSTVALMWTRITDGGKITTYWN